jgi:hypothetical protein
LDVRFGATLQLVGYDVWPSGTTNLGITGISITTYWRVNQRVPRLTFPQIVLFPAGETPQVISDLPTEEFLPLEQWVPGQTSVLATRSIIPAGGATWLGIGARVMSGSGTQTPLPPVVIPTASGTASVDSGTGAVIFAHEPVIP